MFAAGKVGLGSLVATVAERLPKEMLSLLVEGLATRDEHSNPSERIAVSYTIPQGNAREMVADLIRCWNEEEPALSPRSLALALQSACEVDEHHRTGEEARLIWTGPDASSLPYAINSRASSGIDVMCVFESQDASGGKVSFSPVKQLGLVPAVKTFVWPLAKRRKDPHGHYGSLHAKCAVVDGDFLFLSSANLTKFAFNLNMELGVLIKGGPLPSAAESHFRILISTGYLERIYASS